MLSSLPTAQCSVCKLLFKTVASSGVLRRHGYGGSHPPCPGTGLPPLGGLSSPGAGILDTALLDGTLDYSRTIREC